MSMNSFIKRIFLCLIICSIIGNAATTNDSSISENIPFAKEEQRLGTHMWLWLQGGMILPMNELRGVIDNDYNTLIGIRFSYWNSFYAHLSVDYSYLNCRQADFHHAVGKVGLDWEIPKTYGAELGLGLGLFFLRAKEIRELVSFVDNESDYGVYFRVQTPALVLGNFDFSAEAMWDIVFTLPERSEFLRLGLNARYKLW